jgi:hypothetical protein
MSHNNHQLPFLVATLTSGCAGLALTSAVNLKDDEGEDSHPNEPQEG